MLKALLKPVEPHENDKSVDGNRVGDERNQVKDDLNDVRATTCTVHVSRVDQPADIALCR